MIPKVLDFSLKTSALHADALDLGGQQNRDAVHTYDHIPAGEHPALHEIHA